MITVEVSTPKLSSRSSNPAEGILDAESPFPVIGPYVVIDDFRGICQELLYLAGLK
jgi:hypothetical protein